MRCWGRGYYPQPLWTFRTEAEALETEADACGAAALGIHLFVAFLWEGEMGRIRSGEEEDLAADPAGVTAGLGAHGAFCFWRALSSWLGRLWSGRHERGGQRRRGDEGRVGRGIGRIKVTYRLSARSGTTCSRGPRPRFAIRWEFSAKGYILPFLNIADPTTYHLTATITPGSCWPTGTRFFVPLASENTTSLCPPAFISVTESGTPRNCHYV